MRESTGIWFKSANTTIEKAFEGIRFCLNQVEFYPGTTYILIISDSGFGIFQPQFAPPHTCILLQFDGSMVNKFHQPFFLGYIAGRIVSVQPKQKTFQELYFRRYNV
jgi:hypothetical protein